MKPVTSLFSSRRAAVFALALCLLGFPPGARAAQSTPDNGARLLETELLPGKVPLLKAKCDPLVIAVSKTTLAHPDAAVSILHAALTRGVKKRRGEEAAILPCSCARRIFLASMAAAPKRSSEFLDLATELYPDCAAEFASAAVDFEAQSRFGNSLNQEPGGFGVGFGPGFPGSPGFTGSAPSGATALPPVAVTVVVNG